MYLTRHFCEYWEAEVGGRPTVGQVMEIMQAGIRVQAGEPDQTLSIYWHPAWKVVISVDEFNGRVVSLLTPKSKERHLSQRAQRKA